MGCTSRQGLSPTVMYGMCIELPKYMPLMVTAELPSMDTCSGSTVSINGAEEVTAWGNEFTKCGSNELSIPFKLSKYIASHPPSCESFANAKGDILEHPAHVYREPFSNAC